MIAPNILIMSLMSTVVWCQCPDYAVQLIDGLNTFFQFDHNIFFMDSTNNHDRWIRSTLSSSKCRALNDYPPQTSYSFEDFLDTDNTTDPMALNATISKNQLLIVVVERLKFKNDSMLPALIKHIHKLNINVKVGVFFTSNLTTLDIVEQWFRWSWSSGIVNIFGAFHFKAVDGETTFNVFKYSPFSSFHLINVTLSECCRDYFSNKIPNYRQHPLKLEVVREFPVSFFEDIFWNTVLDVFNASASMLYVSYKDSFSRGKLVADVSQQQDYIDGYSQQLLYPHAQSMLVMIVPHAQPYSTLMAYLRNGIWSRFIVLACIVIASSSVVLMVSGYLKQKKIFLFQCIADVVNLLLNDNAAINYRSLDRSNAFVIVPLTFTGLIVMNGVASLFRSHLTSPIYQDQINTLEGLYKSSLPILTDEIEWKDKLVGLLEHMTNYGNWSNRVVGRDSIDLINEMETFNNSIAFFADNYEASVFLEAQIWLGVKIYHVLSETFLVKYLISYLAATEFPFREALNDIVHQLSAAGLIDRWIAEQDERQTEKLWKLNLSRQIWNETNDFSVLTLVWCGWITSVAVFICEIIWHRVKTFRNSVQETFCCTI